MMVEERRTEGISLGNVVDWMRITPLAEEHERQREPEEHVRARQHLVKMVGTMEMVLS